MVQRIIVSILLLLKMSIVTAEEWQQIGLYDYSDEYDDAKGTIYIKTGSIKRSGNRVVYTVRNEGVSYGWEMDYDDIVTQEMDCQRKQYRHLSYYDSIKGKYITTTNDWYDVQPSDAEGITPEAVIHAYVCRE